MTNRSPVRLTCPVCGNTVNHSPRCSNCNTLLMGTPEDTTGDSASCPSCGSLKFTNKCTWCGYKSPALDLRHNHGGDQG